MTTNPLFDESQVTRRSEDEVEDIEHEEEDEHGDGALEIGCHSFGIFFVTITESILSFRAVSASFQDEEDIISCQIEYLRFALVIHSIVHAFAFLFYFLNFVRDYIKIHQVDQYGNRMDYKGRTKYWRKRCNIAVRLVLFSSFASGLNYLIVFETQSDCLDIEQPYEDTFEPTLYEEYLLPLALGVFIKFCCAAFALFYLFVFTIIGGNTVNEVWKPLLGGCFGF